MAHVPFNFTFFRTQNKASSRLTQNRTNVSKTQAGGDNREKTDRHNARWVALICTCWALLSQTLDRIIWTGAWQDQQNDMCAQWRLRSAQSDQSLRCALNRKLRTQGFFRRTAKTLIRLDGLIRPGWYESSLGAHVILLCCGSFISSGLFYLCKMSRSISISRGVWSSLIWVNTVCTDQSLYKLRIILHPTSKTLTGHTGFGLSVRVSIQKRACHILWTVHARVLYGFICFFFLDWVISLSGAMPLWKKSEWSLMHALCYEPCMLGFWSFIYGFLMEK